MSNDATNWFYQGGANYARYRPDYPPALARHLATLSPGASLAVDVGCGTGQLTTQLADHFERTLGLDPSRDQLANATAHPRVEYRCSSAEQLQVDSGSASLVTAAQAAHWFDLPRFYAEVRRVAQPRAVIALLSYGVLTLEGPLHDRFQRFYAEEIGPYWPPERRLVDTGYAGIDFPFDEQPGPRMDIVQRWELAAFLGYVSTWSAVRSAHQAGQDLLLDQFADDVRQLWGAPSDQREMRWPINMRLGRL